LDLGGGCIPSLNLNLQAMFFTYASLQRLLAAFHEMTFAYYSQKAYDTPEQLILGERQYTHKRQPGIKPDCIYHCRCFFFIVVVLFVPHSATMP
jgi:hypothetical protein